MLPHRASPARALTRTHRRPRLRKCHEGGEPHRGTPLRTQRAAETGTLPSGWHPARYGPRCVRCLQCCGQTSHALRPVPLEQLRRGHRGPQDDLAATSKDIHPDCHLPPPEAVQAVSVPRMRGACAIRITSASGRAPESPRTATEPLRLIKCHPRIRFPTHGDPVERRP